jgi:hypothetical protein
MKTSPRLRLLTLSIAALWTLLPWPALGQAPTASDVAQAREFFNQGKALHQKGDDVGALEKLKAARALANTPVIGAELAQTQMALGQLVEAEETFLSVGRIPVGPEETPRSAAARRESATLAEQLLGRIPKLTVRVTGVAADSVAVTIDDALVPKEALSGPRLLNPGHHRVLAKSTSGGSAETSIELKEGEARDVELKIAFSGGTVAPAPTASVPTAPSPWGPSTSSDGASAPSPGAPKRVLGWSLLVGGAAVLVGGGVVMGLETAAASDANRNHDKASYDSAKTLWTVGLIGSVAGVVAAASGGIVLATSGNKEREGRSQPTVWFGLGYGDLRVGGAW